MPQSIRSHDALVVILAVGTIAVAVDVSAGRRRGTRSSTVITQGARSAAGSPTFDVTKSVDLDGVNDYATTPDDDIWDTDGNGLSVCGWANVPSDQPGFFWNYLVARYTQPGARQLEWGVFMDQLDSLQIGIAINAVCTGSLTGVRSAINLVPDTWTHWCVTYPETVGVALGDQVKWYLDGALVPNGTAAGTGAALPNCATPTTIGHDITESLTLDGRLHGVLVVEGVLSAADVLDIYNDGTPKDESARSGLIAFWRLGDGDTYPTLLDSGPNLLHLTMTNMDAGDIVEDAPPATAWSTKSVRFNDGSTDEYVTAADHASFTDQSFTLSFWIKVAETQGSVASYVWSRADSTTTHEWQIDIGATTTRKLAFITHDDCDQTDGGAMTHATADGVLPDNEWAYVALTVNMADGATCCQFYIDGAAVTTNHSGATITSIMDCATTTQLGRGRDSGGTRNYRGNLDEVAMFSSVLTATQINWIYRSGKPASLAPLAPIWWIRGGDAAGDSFPTLDDQGSLGVDGTATNMEAGDFEIDAP